MRHTQCWSNAFMPPRAHHDGHFTLALLCAWLLAFWGGNAGLDALTPALDETERAR
jgi:hypothetical protein